MSFQVNILSLSASFPVNKPAVSGFGTAEAESLHELGPLVHRSPQSPEISRRTSTKTLVDEEDGSLMESFNWIPGVGDLCHGTLKERNNLKLCEEKNAHQITPPSSSSLKENPNTKRSALRRHCEFWDTNQDGLIYPWDIFLGFRRLGFNLALCLWAAVTMAICSSYATQTSWLPHPMFAINLDNIHSSRHGSTTGAYDLDDDLDLRRFDAIFQKYADGKNYLTGKTLYQIWRGQCVANDWFGWFAGGLEWIAMYILLWPEDGKMYKEQIRGVYDGSIFEKIAQAQTQRRKCKAST